MSHGEQCELHVGSRSNSHRCCNEVSECERDYCIDERFNWDPVFGIDCAAALDYALHFVSHGEGVGEARYVGVGKLSGALSELLGIRLALVPSHR